MKECPEGAVSGLSWRRGARGGGCSVWRGPAPGGWAGRHPVAAVFPRLVGAAGDECGGARPRPASGVSSSVPAFLSVGSRSRCPRPSGAFELSRPLDDQLASRPGWAGIVLHPYAAGNSPQTWYGGGHDGLASTPLGRPARLAAGLPSRDWSEPLIHTSGPPSSLWSGRRVRSVAGVVTSFRRRRPAAGLIRRLGRPGW